MDSKRNQQQQGNNQSRPKQQQRQQGQQQAPQKPKQVWMTREQFEKSQNQEEDLGRRFNEQQYYQGQQVQQQQMFHNGFTYDQQFPQQNSYFPRQQYQQQQQQQQQYQWQRVNLAEERDQQTHYTNGTQNNRQQKNSYNNQYFVEKVGTDQPSIEDIFSRTTNSYANMPNQGQNGFPSFQNEGLSYQNNNFPPKNELKPKNNNNNSKNDNFRPKSSQQPANVKSTSNNPSNRVPEKPQQQQQAGGAKGKQSDGNSKQNKSKQSMKQFDKVLQQMGSLFDTEEDLQLSQEYPKAGISNSGWECSSCGKLNWWLRKLCKTCGDFQVKICDRMQRLSPGEVEQFDYLFFIDYECNQTYNGGGSEIIEFPIVVVGVQQKAIVDTYEAFVKPDFKITKFITKLTTITNENVAKAPKLRNTISNVTEFLRNYTEVLSKPDRCAVVYDNKSDADFLHQETARKKIKLPSILTTYINLKDVFPVVFSNPPRVPKSLADMQGILKQSFEGTQHRGIDDATNQANVGVECLARGYSFKKDMLLNINPQLLPKVQGESGDTHADVIIHLEFHIEMDNKIVEGEGEEESKDADDKETKKMNQDEENKNEGNSEDDAGKNHENPASNNANTDTKKKSERKGKKPKSFGIDCIRSCSCAISEFDPKTKQFILSSHGVLTLEMFERSNLKESKKNANESTSQQDQEQEQAPATPEQLQVLQNVAIQIASFLQLQSSSLKSKRVILLTSNQSHKFVTSLLLDSCNQLSLKGDAEIDSATRILVMYLNYFALFKEEIYGIMRDSNNAARYVKQFKEISWSMNDFGRKSPEDKIKMVIEIQNSLINITGKCTLDRENVKKVLS